MKDHEKNFWRILGLIVSVSAILAYVAADNSVMAQLIKEKPVVQGAVSMHASLVQDKVLRGSDGKVAVSLTLTAAEMPDQEDRPASNTDLVIVLDRSGSMKGQKITDAKKAVLGMVDRLGANDRMALITYSNVVDTLAPLAAMDPNHRHRLREAAENIFSHGGTNLGSGLERGIHTLMQTPAGGRMRKVILISDGLANHGITDPARLGNMASGAVEHNYSVSTVGVGYDFNEVLMTTIADHGSGSYYFLENPNAFAQVFEKEFDSTRNVAASSLELRVPLNDGVQLVHAGGYPIENRDGYAMVRPGDLLSGQKRKIYLTFKVPTNKTRDYQLGGITVQYARSGDTHQLSGTENLTLACVADPKAVTASIDKKAWEDRVVKEDYNKLKDQVANAIRDGRKSAAFSMIQDYEARTHALNNSVGSEQVAENLEIDVQQLRQSVEETFAGAPAEVAKKQKQRSKALQYESYQIRRDKR